MLWKDLEAVIKKTLILYWRRGDSISKTAILIGSVLRLSRPRQSLPAQLLM